MSGSYFDGEDLYKDGVVIDENVAWQLFGSNNVAGMYVEINGVQYPVRGVVKSDKGYLSDEADEEATDILRSDDADEEATDVLRSDDADDSTAVLQGGRAASSVRMIKNVIIVHSDEEI